MHNEQYKIPINQNVYLLCKQKLVSNKYTNTWKQETDIGYKGIANCNSWNKTSL